MEVLLIEVVNECTDQLSVLHAVRSLSQNLDEVCEVNVLSILVLSENLTKVENLKLNLLVLHIFLITKIFEVF